jgi:two-component system, OmpR family, response regulator MtrA
MIGHGSVDNGGTPLRPKVMASLAGCWWEEARGLRGRVLVVDDDPSLGEMLGIVLRQEGFEPVFVRSGDQAIAAFHQAKPDLVLLDLMLRMESGVPIVMLTAKTDTVDIVLGLESGADDYITKPFSAKELVARIRARLRRRDTEGAETLRFHDIEMDVMAHQVSKGGKPINLTPLEFELLATLARRPRQVFTREVLLEQVWGYRYAGDTRLVNVHVQRLRAKIEDDPENPRVVQTVRGVGYRIGPDTGAEDAGLVPEAGP